ncbi:MAG TPA: tyrosine--tRNA ligase, partial [Ruminococcus sp.]|nr:tyrosine--tRNA ligase [Ruminococcus sp.]
FGGAGISENMPSTELTADDLNDGKIGLLNLLVKTKLCPSVSEARRLVQQGGITVNNEKVSDPKTFLSIDGEVIIKKGKKIYHKVVMKG